ncbi:MAG: hypothetical protein DHS20C21_18940 [Gemmatimonadota bacterium]|nr:MAG: hypothetical protein DHS20C21_18940 [Gemmatimonadota bacterium]
MQTPAERALVAHLVALLPKNGSPPARLLAVGAGRSLSVENQLTAAHRTFVSDRVDVDECSVADPRVERSWVCSAEAMEPVESGAYDAAFANYVLEHVPDVRRAAAEIHRVLRPGGRFVTSVPNPRALEFRLANATPLGFHRFVRGEEAWPTHYDYRTVRGLVEIFEGVGFRTLQVDQFAFVEGYLHRFPLLGPLGRLYDGAINRLGIRAGQGNVCAVFER